MRGKLLLSVFVCIFVTMTAPATADPLHWVARADRHSHYLHGPRGMVTRDSPGVFLWFAGTGGSRQYGIQSSMTPILQMHLDAGFDAVAAENPIYWRREGTDDERRPFIDRFGTLRAQMRWFYSVLQDVVDECARVGDPGKEIYLAGRSMGSGLAAQALHEYLQGAESAAVVGRVKAMFLGGLHGHLPEDLDEMMRLEYIEHVKAQKELSEWQTALAKFPDPSREREQFLRKNPEPATLDALVLPKGPLMYREMSWAPERGTAVRASAERARHVPRVVGILGMRDQYIAPWIGRRTYERFLRRHPDVPVRVVLADTAHDPSRGDKYADVYGDLYRDHTGNFLIKYAPLERLRPVMELLVNESGRRRAVPGEWNELFLPNRETVQAAPACLSYLAQAMAIPDVELHAFYREFFDAR